MGVESCGPVRTGHASGSCRVLSPLCCAVALGPRPESGRCAVVAAPGFSLISGSAARSASADWHLRPGRHLGCELADPAHALAGRVGVVAELLGHPANAAMDAEPPYGSRDCFCCHCGGRGVRLLQPRGEQRRALVAACRAGGTMVGRCGGVRVADGCHHELSGAGLGRRAQPVRAARSPGVRRADCLRTRRAWRTARASAARWAWWCRSAIRVCPRACMVVGCIIVVSSGAELSFVHLWMVGADAGTGRHPKVAWGWNLAVIARAGGAPRGGTAGTTDITVGCKGSGSAAP